MAGTTTRWRLAIFALLVVCASLATTGGVAFAAPGPITGLSSSTHPVEATWYSSANPAFAWNPVLANGSAITGYSYVLDQNAATVPDLSSERLSLDYLARVAYPTGAAPTEVRVGDLNGDGFQDIVSANGTGNSVSVLLGNGNGTFRAKVDYVTNTKAWSMELGDLNRDGKLDVIVGCLNADRVSVLLGRGDGTLNTKVDYRTGAQPECMRIGLLNNDAYLDIVTSNANDNTLSVLLGKGDGTFNAKVDYATAVHPTSLDIGDMNADGKQDLIAANFTPSTVSILLGKGDGTFNVKVDYATGAGPFTVIVADVNKDGKLDAETVNNTAATASILIGNGNGTLKPKVDYPVGSSPYALDVRDLNQDGAPDVVTSNNGANTASVLMGNGDGTFIAKTDFATGTAPFWVTIGDFNGDGYGDLVTSDYSASTASVRLGTAYLNVGFSAQADGIWYFHVRALDALGAGGAAAHRTVRIDATAPVTTQTGADSGWHNAAVTVALSASDATSGVAGTQYKVDAGSWTSGTSLVVPAPSNGSNDGSHTVSYRSTDVAGNLETTKTCTVNIVTSAPTTSVTGADSAWHASAVTLGFSSGSLGVTKTEYRIDGGAWVEGSSAVVPAPADGSNDGIHTVEYRSTNGAGYVETAKSATVKIDAGAPTTSVSGADNAWHHSDVTLGFSGSDAGSGVALTEYRVDGGAWTTGTSVVVPASSDGSNDGTHGIQYRSTDAMGHVETAKSATVKIDVGPPTTTVNGSDGAWHRSDVTLGFSGTDSTSGVALTEYRVDGGSWTTGTSVVIPAPGDGSNDGTHTVQYRSTDAAGNVETAKNVDVKIDGGAPTTTVSGADGAWHGSDVTLGFSGSDSASGVALTEYRVDGGSWTTGTSVVIPASADGSNDGTHTVQYRSTDAAGNVETAKNVDVKIVTSAPTTSVTGADGAWHASDVTLGFSSASLGVTKTEYRIDGGDWVEGDAAVVPAPADGSNDGVRTVEYRSTNGAGYVETAKSATVKIDAGAPTTTISGADNAWHASDVTLGFSGSDSASGVALTEYRIDGGPWIEDTSTVIAAPSDGSNDGEHVVEYRSTDVAGNVETAESHTVKIDTAAPTTTPSSDEGIWYAGPYTLDLVASDATSGMTGGLAKTEYSTDGGVTWETGSSVHFGKWRRTGGSGQFTVLYRSTDAAGILEPVGSTVVNVDTSAPRTTSDAPSDPQTTDVTVTLTGHDSYSGIDEIWYSVDDGGTWTLGNSVLVPATDVGLTTICYFSIDKAGNRQVGYSVAGVTIEP